MTEEELTPIEPPPMAEVVPGDECTRLRDKYDSLVKQTATLIEILAKLKEGTLKIEEIDLKAGQKE